MRHTTIIYYPTIKKNKNYTAKVVLYLGSKRHALTCRGRQVSSPQMSGWATSGCSWPLCVQLSLPDCLSLPPSPSAHGAPTPHHQCQLLPSPAGVNSAHSGT